MSPMHSRGSPTKGSKIRIGCLSPSRGPKSGRKCYATVAFSGVPNKGQQNQNWLPQPCLLRGPKVSGGATSLLHYGGSPTKGTKIRIGCLNHAFSRHKSGRRCYVTLHSRGSPKKGSKMRIGCLSHAFLGAQKWAEVLCHTCILGGPQQRGAKSELAASVMPSRGPQSGRKCYVTLAFSGGGQQRAAKSELATSAMPFRGPKSGQKCYATLAFSGVPNKGKQNQNWLPQPCLLRGPKVGGSAISPLYCWGFPTKGSKIRIGYLSHAFSGAQKWAEVLRHPCILRGPQQRGAKSELAASAMPSPGPKSGWKCYATLAFFGVPNKGEQNQNWLPQPCLLRGQKVGGSATPPLHSQGSPTKRSKIRMGCLNHAFSGAKKWAEVLRNPSILEGFQQRGAKSELNASAMPSRGPKSRRKCYVIPAFSGVPNKGGQNQNWLPQPCLPKGPKSGHKCYVTLAFSGVPNKGEQNQNWPPQPCLLRGPKVGGSATSPLHSRGSPTKGSKIRNWLPQPCLFGGPKVGKSATPPLQCQGCPTRGAKSELTASTMPSRGPKSGQKCYVTLPFSGVPNKGGQNQNWLPQPCLLRGPKVGKSATSPLHSRGSQ